MNEPKKNFPYFTTNIGSYNLLDFNEKQIQFTFFLPDKPEFASNGFISTTINIEHQWLSSEKDILYVAQKIKEVIDKYLFNSDKVKIDNLVKYLEENDNVFYERKLHYKIALATYKISKLVEEIEKEEINESIDNDLNSLDLGGGY